MARRIALSSRSSMSASDWLLLAVTWQPREGLQTLIYSTGSSVSADRVSLLTTCDCLPILAALRPSPERMSTRTLPLLFINLGGEMLYILDQRLRAQNIPADKAKKGRWQLIYTRELMKQVMSSFYLWSWFVIFLKKQLDLLLLLCIISQLACVWKQWSSWPSSVTAWCRKHDIYEMLCHSL